MDPDGNYKYSYKREAEGDFIPREEKIVWLLALKMEEGVMSKNTRNAALEAEKKQGNRFSPSFLEECGPADTVALAQLNSFQTSDVPNC